MESKVQGLPDCCHLFLRACSIPSSQEADSSSVEMKRAGAPHRCLATCAQTSLDTSPLWTPLAAPGHVADPSSAVALLVVGSGAMAYTACTEAESCFPSLSYWSILLARLCRETSWLSWWGPPQHLWWSPMSDCGGGGCFLLALPLFLGVDGEHLCHSYF